MKRIRLGITGQFGFIGSHLFNYLGTKESVKRISFQKGFFYDEFMLEEFVKKCDVIVHLASLNRLNDGELLHKTNLSLVKNLIKACEKTKSTPYILFSSSTQEERRNFYGKSKREGRKLFESWALRNNAKFSSLQIPNVFGPFGKPFYNSFIATFCHQLVHGKTPSIERNTDVKLIYSNELIKEIYRIILEGLSNLPKSGVFNHNIAPTSTQKVSEVLYLLKDFKLMYFDKGIIPDLSIEFNKNLFNTFRCFISDEHYPVNYQKHVDERGDFVEIGKMNTPGQFSFSTTKPGVTRGNHFHTRKVERFAVIKGKALIQLRKIGSDKVINYKMDGNIPSFVDMPIWTTHNITNIGNEELVTLFWINEPYCEKDSDTFFEIV